MLPLINLVGRDLGGLRGAGQRVGVLRELHGEGPDRDIIEHIIR